MAKAPAGANVIDIQKKLKDAGYNLAGKNNGVDGIWGTSTQKAYDDYVAKQNTSTPSSSPTYPGQGLLTAPGAGYKPPIPGDMTDPRNQVGSGLGASAVQMANGGYAQGDIATLKAYLNTLGAKLDASNNNADAALTAALQKYGSSANPAYLKQVVNPSGQNSWQYQANGLMGNAQNADPNPFAQANGGIGSTPQGSSSPYASGGGYSDPSSGALGYDASAYTKYYEDALAQAQAAQISATGATTAQYDAQKPVLAQAYADANKGAYATSRLSALGNNEVLAAQGVAGNPYADAMSGRSETSRIAGDVAMQNSLNANQQGYTKALADIGNTIAQAQAAGNQQLADLASEYYVQMAQAQMQSDQMNNQNYWNQQNLSAQQQQNGQAQSNWQSEFNFAQQQYADSQKKKAAGPSNPKSNLTPYELFLQSGKTAKSSVSTWGPR